MKHDVGTAVGELAFGPLAFLSLQHPLRDGTPDAPSNEERIRAFRNTLPVTPGNNYDWAFRNVLRAASG